MIVFYVDVFYGDAVARLLLAAKAMQAIITIKY